MIDGVSLTGVPQFSFPTIDEQAALVERHGLSTLFFCPDPWALRHVFINHDTGEVVRARCNRWDCLDCGRAKYISGDNLCKNPSFRGVAKLL